MTNRSLVLGLAASLALVALAGLAPVASAHCTLSLGPCEGHCDVNAGICEGEGGCGVNAARCWGGCDVNLGLCGGECDVNTGICEGDCAVNTGYCPAGAHCLVSLESCDGFAFRPLGRVLA